MTVVLNTSPLFSGMQLKMWIVRCACSATERILARDSGQVDKLLDGNFSALHIAANNDHVDCVKLLVKNVSWQVIITTQLMELSKHPWESHACGAYWGNTSLCQTINKGSQRKREDKKRDFFSPNKPGICTRQHHEGDSHSYPSFEQERLGKKRWGWEGVFFTLLLTVAWFETCSSKHLSLQGAHLLVQCCKHRFAPLNTHFAGTMLILQSPKWEEVLQGHNCKGQAVATRCTRLQPLTQIYSSYKCDLCSDKYLQLNFLKNVYGHCLLC